MMYFISSACSVSQIRNNTNIISITFWEQTTNNTAEPVSFSVNSEELLNRINDRPSHNNNDFTGWNEFYDVFYSDEAGNFDIDGAFISIEAIFDLQKPYHGGLNISEVQLNYNDGKIEFANSVTSFKALGDNTWLDSIKNAADSKIETTTWMGNTIGSQERLRITVGFRSIAGLLKRLNFFKLKLKS